MALLIVVVELTYQGYPGQPLVLTTLTGGRGEVVRGALPLGLLSLLTLRDNPFLIIYDALVLGCPLCVFST